MMAYGQDIEPQKVVPKPEPVKYKDVDRFDECKFHSGLFIYLFVCIFIFPNFWLTNSGPVIDLFKTLVNVTHKF